jgi:Bacterial Ig domain
MIIIDHSGGIPGAGMQRNQPTIMSPNKTCCDRAQFALRRRRLYPSRRISRILLLIAFVIGGCGQAAAAEVTLEWDPNPEPGIDGYKIHYGTAVGEYGNFLDVGNVTTARVPGLAAGTTYFFVATAYNTDGLESAYSNQVTFTTASPNAAPVSMDIWVTVTEDYSVTMPLIASDPDGDPLSYTIISIPASGTLSGTPPLLTYTPDPNFHGSDSFRFVASDGELASQEAVISISVTSVNDAPVAKGISLATVENIPLTIRLPASDVDGDALTFSITSLPAHGTLSGDPSELTFRPDAGFNGNISFRYVATDGMLESSKTLAEIAVAPANDRPTALSATVTTTVEEAVSLTLAGIDPENGPLSFSVVSNPSQGTLSGNPPDLLFTPDPGFVGTTSFPFNAHDGELTSPAATIQIRVVRPGAWELIAVSDDPATGTGGARFAAFTPAVRSDAGGDAAFRALLDSPAGSGSGIWVESEGALALVARQGSSAPGVNGGLFQSFPTSPWFGGSGHFFFQATLQIGPGGVTTANDSGFWYRSPASPLQLVAREGFVAGDGTEFLSFGSGGLGDGGKFAFSASIKANSAMGITSANDSGIWAHSDGSFISVVREGDPAPGSSGSSKFESLANTAVSVNSSGNLAFAGTLRTSTGVTRANKYGVWMWDGIRLTEVVRAGDPAPGALPAAVFGRPDSPLLRTPMLVLHATLTGVNSSNDSGLWKYENGSVSLLALEGAPAPGSGSGAVFDSFPHSPAGNDRGDIIFRASLRGAGAVTSSNNSGMWARSPGTGNLVGLIARENETAPQTPAGAVFASFDSAVVSGSGQEAFTASLVTGGSVSASNDRGLWMRSTDGRFLLLLREGDALPLSDEDVRIVSAIALDSSSESGAASFGGDASIKVLVTFTDGSSAVMSCTAP